METRIWYPYLPKMEQCNGCGDCCGPIVLTAREARIIVEYAATHKIKWRPKVLRCGFLGRNKKCRIYQVRPFICRLYGVARELRCPHFPEAATISFPAGNAVSGGWMEPYSELLPEVMAAK